MGSDEPSEVQAYLAAIVDSSDDAIISKDLFGTIKSFNGGAERMFGYTAQEVIGKPVTILIPESMRAEETAILARLRRGERIDHFETVRITKDRRLIEVSLTVSPVRNAAGEIVGASKIARNITERNQSARALAAQQEWFRTTLASIGDGVIVSDAKGHVSFLNPIAEKLTGWDAKDAKEQRLDDVFNIINENTRERIESPAHMVISGRRIVGLANHTVLISRTGVETPISDSAAPIMDDAQRVAGVVLVFRDVTHERASENAERAARAEAEKANRSKDEFLAMVSHELRTPLNAVIGWTDLLCRGSVDPATLRQGLEVIARNARIQTQVVSDLLDTSRIVAGKLHLNIEVVDLPTLLKGSVESMRHAAETKKIEMRQSIETQVGPVAADTARLSQVIWNVLSNAIKFTPEGGWVEVVLRAAPPVAVIEITDGGIGISAEDLPRLFERFRQRGPAAGQRSMGLGIGLSIAKHLTELHGGSITASSGGEGTGSRFTIQLPLASATAAAAVPLASGTLDSSAVSLKGLQILVVEDDPDSLGLLERVLRVHDAEVTAVRSGEEALAAFDASRPHMLISDIGLPQMSGYELMANIRKREDGRSFIPAIALTAFARGQDRTHALRAGYQVHIAKPFEIEQVVTTVAGLADVARGRGAIGSL